MGLRSATAADAAILLAWANDPATRAASRSHATIDPDEHVRWLGSRLATPDDARIWIGEVDGAPVGTVRVERRAPDLLEVSITVAPDHRGRGLARPLLEAGLAAATHAFPGHAVVADVLEGNERSLALFEGAGFARVPELGASAPGGVVRLIRR